MYNLKYFYIFLFPGIYEFSFKQSSFFINSLILLSIPSLTCLKIKILSLRLPPASEDIEGMVLKMKSIPDDLKRILDKIKFVQDTYIDFNSQ